MKPFEVIAASASDEESVISVLALAFSSDPMARWSQPDPRLYLAMFPILARALGGAAFEKGSAYFADGYGGAALWLPPGVHPDEKTLVALVEKFAPANILPDLSGVYEQMEKFHPTEPHWYLLLIGVDPSQQGRGIGSALMKHALETIDRDHLPAYLESSNPMNISLYEHHGFEVIGEIQVGSSPPMRPMYRAAR